MDKYSPGRYDPLTGNYFPADLSNTNTEAAAAANTKTADAFTVTQSGLNVVANGKYQFSFAYLYSDPNNSSNLIPGKRSPNFVVTLQTPDLTQPVTNLSVTPGLLSYGVKWDLIDSALPANKWLIDIQIYESLTGAFTGEEYLVWNGNGNSATILVSNTANRWIRVDTRDQDFRKKSVTYGPFKATDPIVVDTTGPANVSSVTTVGSLDLDGVIGFHGHATISWPAVTGGGIRGYRIRWRQLATPATAYSYVDSPGTNTTYHLQGLGVGLTYEFAVATYDEYNNTSSQYVAGPNVTITGTPYIAGTVDVAGYFRAKANPTDADSTAFKFGYGIETGKRGLAFNSSNYWHIDSNQSALFKVGGPTTNYLLWDGAKLTVDGDVNAKGGIFSGNIYMTTNKASIYNGTIDSATGNLTGDGFALNSTGLKVASGTKSVTIASATGTITANAGSIGGWTLGDSTLSKNNIILDSAGQIQVGSSATASVYLKSSGSFVMWAGNNTPDANAKFRVGSDGTLYAQNAVLGSGTTVAGYATTGSLANYALTSALASYATTQALADVKTKADAALPSTSFSKLEVLKKLNNSTNGATLSGGILEAGTVVADNVVSTYVYAGFIDAEKIRVGTLSGQTLIAGTAGTSYYFNSKGTKNNIVGLVINAIGIESSTTGGITSHWYPYVTGNIDLGIIAYPWNDARLTGNLMVGYTPNGVDGVGTSGTNASSGPKIKLFGSGPIFANTLGLGSGNTIVQDGGYLKVQTSSLRYKENINQTNKDGYLDIINLLKPVTYNYIGDTGYNGNPRKLSGLIAEDLHEIPQLRTVVNYNEEDQPDGIAYDRLTASLILALQELTDMVKSLQTEVNTLKGI